jgi:hypothetical protein
MKFELWRTEFEDSYSQTLCLADSRGDQARALEGENAVLVWTTEAINYFEANTKYYEFMGWGTYTSDYEQEDSLPIPELDSQPFEEISDAK